MRRATGLAAAIALVAAACGGDAAEPTVSTVALTTTTVATTRPPPPPISPTAESLDTHRPSGNRVYAGSGAITAVTPVDVPLEGTPQWVVAVPGGATASWMVALDDGRLVFVEGGVARATGITIDPGSPPVVVTERGVPSFAIGAPRSEASTLSAARVFQGSLWWIATDGRLFRERTGAQFIYEVDALIDSRIAIRSNGLAAVLAEPTDRYPHGIAGDTIEAAAVAVVDPRTGDITSFAVDEVAVVEGTSPMWVDADGDGDEELLVTLSDAAGGARLALFSPSGTLIAEGPPVGTGNRWRHQIGAGPVGPAGELEIVSVETPHIGGIANWYRLEDGALRIVASADGITSHTLFSRNMDMALIADADGDGTLELVTPTPDLTGLTGLARTDDGVDVAWTEPLGGRLVSNVAAAETSAGRLAVAAGTDADVLRVWEP